VRKLFLFHQVAFFEFASSKILSAWTTIERLTGNIGTWDLEERRQLLDAQNCVGDVTIR
jgi:hypothetical protein